MMNAHIFQFVVHVDTIGLAGLLYTIIHGLFTAQLNGSNDAITAITAD